MRLSFGDCVDGVAVVVAAIVALDDQSVVITAARGRDGVSVEFDADEARLERRALALAFERVYGGREVCL